MEESTGEFNLREAADELTSDGTDDASTQETSVDGQSERTPNETTNEETSAKDILAKINEEKPEVNQALIDQINAIGAIHKGMPISVNSPEQLKELLQKGFDYTQKTMAHAEESRVKAEEFAKREASYQEKDNAYAQREKELENVSHENRIMESMVRKWQTDDPELFAYIQQAYQKEVNSYEMQKPLISKYENQFKELNDKFSRLEQGKQQEQLGSIKNGWEKELNDVQTQSAAALNRLGVTPDWKKVQEAWTADATGKLSVEDALYAVHGKDIAKANESYQKLLVTRNKSQASKLGRGASSNGQRSSETIKAPAGDYESILRQALTQI